MQANHSGQLAIISTAGLFLFLNFDIVAILCFITCLPQKFPIGYICGRKKTNTIHIIKIYASSKVINQRNFIYGCRRTGFIILIICAQRSSDFKTIDQRRKNWDKIDLRRIREAVQRLNHKRFIELAEKNNKLYIKITTNGKQLIKNFDYDNLKLPQPKIWDKKWQMVIFDVPEKKNKERRALSTKLKDLGFYPLQKSVFVYPYDCQDEIDFICSFLFIDRYVNYCVVDILDKKEGDLRKFFNLLS